MDQTELMRLIFLLALVVLVGGGTLWGSGALPRGKTVTIAAVWIAVFVAFATGYNIWNGL